MGDPLVVPCCEPSDDCEGPGYTPCARFKQDAECYRTSQIDMDELICMVIRRDEEIECLQARIAEPGGERDDMAVVHANLRVAHELMKALAGYRLTRGTECPFCDADLRDDEKSSGDEGQGTHHSDCPVVRARLLRLAVIVE